MVGSGGSFPHPLAGWKPSLGSNVAAGESLSQAAPRNVTGSTSTGCGARSSGRGRETNKKKPRGMVAGTSCWLFLRGSVQGLVPCTDGKRFSPASVRSGRQTTLRPRQISAFPRRKKTKIKQNRSGRRRMLANQDLFSWLNRIEAAQDEKRK